MIFVCSKFYDHSVILAKRLAERKEKAAALKAVKASQKK